MYATLKIASTFTVKRAFGKVRVYLLLGNAAMQTSTMAKTTNHLRFIFAENKPAKSNSGLN